MNYCSYYCVRFHDVQASALKLLCNAVKVRKIHVHGQKSDHELKRRNSRK